MALFQYTFRSIDAQGDGRSPLIPAALIAILGAWLGWFCFGKVTVYETSVRARLEVVDARFEVDTQVAGRVLTMPRLALGSIVHKGDVLIELDAETEQLQLFETSAQEATLVRQISATRHETETEQRALEHHRKQSVSTEQAARSRLAEGQFGAQLASDDLRRALALHKSGSISDAELSRLDAAASQRMAARDALVADVRRSASETIISENDRLSRIASLASSLARLEGELAASRARAALLQHYLSQRLIRASADGTIGAIVELHVGSVLKPGDRVATIVASGNLRIVGDFEPVGVFGRVHVGQPARVQFEGFAWTEYGIVTAFVYSVAGEVRDGHARVELIAARTALSRIPLQHGLPVRVAIAVERTTAARLTLRAVGMALSYPANTAASLPER